VVGALGRWGAQSAINLLRKTKQIETIWARWMGSEQQKSSTEPAQMQKTRRFGHDFEQNQNNPIFKNYQFLTIL